MLVARIEMASIHPANWRVVGGMRRIDVFIK